MIGLGSQEAVAFLWQVSYTSTWPWSGACRRSSGSSAPRSSDRCRTGAGRPSDVGGRSSSSCPSELFSVSFPDVPSHPSRRRGFLSLLSLLSPKARTQVCFRNNEVKSSTLEAQIRLLNPLSLVSFKNIRSSDYAANHGSLASFKSSEARDRMFLN